MPGTNETALLDALRGVVDPELGGDIVELGMLKSVEIDDDGRVDVAVALTIAGCPLRAQLRNDIRDRLRVLPGVTHVHVHMSEMDAGQKRTLMARVRKNNQSDVALDTLPRTTHILAISSGKGGVGKSSIAANLSVAIAQEGYNVGVLDADIAGFSIPQLLGCEARLQAASNRIIPVVRSVGKHELRVVSMGMIEGSNDNEAVMLRGLMLGRALQHFLEDVDWNAPDYLVIDMPPGTSDIHMTLARLLPRANLLIVTTPGAAAQHVASRAIDMARRSHLRVAGVVENMSAFYCEHGETYELFGSGGGEELSRISGTPLLAQLPIDGAVAAAATRRTPIVEFEPNARSAQAIIELARRIIKDFPTTTDLSSCSSQVLHALDGAFTRTVENKA